MQKKVAAVALVAVLGMFGSACGDGEDRPGGVVTETDTGSVSGTGTHTGSGSGTGTHAEDSTGTHAEESTGTETGTTE